MVSCFTFVFVISCSVLLCLLGRNSRASPGRVQHVVNSIPGGTKSDGHK